MSRRIVNVSCPICHRLTYDYVVDETGRLAFYHREHTSTPSSQGLLDRRRRRAGGRSPRLPAITALVLDLGDPLGLPVENACHCRRCGRLVVFTGDVMAAVDRYRATGRRQTITAARPAPS